jgi:hypothetical protein
LAQSKRARGYFGCCVGTTFRFSTQAKLSGRQLGVGYDLRCALLGGADEALGALGCRQHLVADELASR